MQHIQLYASVLLKTLNCIFFKYSNKIFLTPLGSLFTGLAGNSWFHWEDLFICYIFVNLQVITKCSLVLRWMRQSVLGATHVTHVCESLKQFWRYTFSRVKNEILNDLVIIMTSKTLLVWNLGSVQVSRFWPKRSIIFFFFLHILILNDQTVVTSTMLNKISITLDLQLFREAFWFLNLVVNEEVLWFCTHFVLYGFTNYFTETMYEKNSKSLSTFVFPIFAPSKHWLHF